VEYQRRGLGSRLVEWGLKHVEGMVRRSEGRLEGCYLIANPAGDKTYRKAGFEMVGERSTEEGLDEKYRHCWFVKKFV
jgi:GNAT superfamily N-acetyltransferase